MLSSGDRLGKLIKFIFILLLLSLIAIAVTPLSIYYDYVKKHLNPVGLTGISGSAVKGSAESLNYMSAPMGKTEWFLYPKTFKGLGGKVRVYQQNYDLTFDMRELSADSHSFNHVTGFIDWQLIKPFMQMRYGQIDGYAQVNLNSVVYNNNTGFDRMEGEVVLQDFKLISPTAKDLGEVKVTFETKKTGMIVGNFTSQSSALNVSGVLVIQPRRWQLNLDIIPKAGNFELDAVLNSVGDPRRGGGRKLNLAGFY